MLSLANYLLLGLKIDMNNLERLNNGGNVEAVRYLLMAVRHWGVVATLNFLRGGTLLNKFLAVFACNQSSMLYFACNPSSML